MDQSMFTHTLSIAVTSQVKPLVSGYLLLHFLSRFLQDITIPQSAILVSQTMPSLESVPA